MSFDLGIVRVAQSVVSKEDDSETESEQQGVTEESEVGHGLVVELEALEGSSGDDQEVDDVEGVETDLDPGNDSEELGKAFNGSSWVSFVPSGGDSAVGNDVVRRVLSLDNGVDQENNSGSSEDKTSNVDGLGESVIDSGLEKLSVGFVGLGGLVGPVDDEASAE